MKDPCKDCIYANGERICKAKKMKPKNSCKSKDTRIRQ